LHKEKTLHASNTITISTKPRSSNHLPNSLAKFISAGSQELENDINFINLDESGTNQLLSALAL
jgi:hypothetical protein